MWIGWDYRHQYVWLKLFTNNSRFVILPDWHVPNLASRILPLCQKRLSRDWQETLSALYTSQLIHQN
ncbi:MAG: Druantia anti-phage system protein DruA [Candidatus Magnetobacterium sp. LHC-1]